jgi:hypothetical protein
MSRAYDMCVEIRDYDPTKKEAIQEAAREEWDTFEDWCVQDGTGKYMQASGRSVLYGVESDDEFSSRLACAIWRANGAYCEVTVNATYLEDLPCETYIHDEEAYQMFLQLGCNTPDEISEEPEVIVTFFPPDDHVCPHCGETKVSLDEKAKGIPCWHCGNPL